MFQKKYRYSPKNSWTVLIIRAQKFLTLEDFSSQIEHRKIKNIKIIVSYRYCYSGTQFQCYVRILSANDRGSQQFLGFLALWHLKDSKKQNNIFSHSFLVTITCSVISEPKDNHVASSPVTIATTYGSNMELLTLIAQKLTRWPLFLLILSNFTWKREQLYSCWLRVHNCLFFYKKIKEEVDTT